MCPLNWNICLVHVILNLCSGYNHMPKTPTCDSCIKLVLTSETTIAYHPLHPHSLGSGKTGNYTNYDQLHSITLLSKHSITVRLVRGIFSRALIMGILLYH